MSASDWVGVLDILIMVFILYAALCMWVWRDEEDDDEMG